MSKNKKKELCKKCQEIKFFGRTCPRCGFYNYTKSQERFFKKIQEEMLEWRKNNPL